MKYKFRKKIYDKYKGKCGYCGRDIEYKQMQVDHVIPQCTKIGGKFSKEVDCEENLMPSCSQCNHYKRAHSLELFRDLMKKLHKRIEKEYINKVAINYGVITLSPFDGTFYFEKLDKLGVGGVPFTIKLDSKYSIRYDI